MPAIINMTSQLLICTLNSGKTLYLAPAEISEPIDPIECAGNEKFDKLVAARLVSIVPVGEPRENDASTPAPASDLAAPVPAPSGVEEQQRALVPVTAAPPASVKASLARFQLLIFTFVFAGLFIMFSIKTGTFVDIPNKVLGLFGISAGNFLVAQALK